MAKNTCTDYEETLRPEEIDDDEDQDDDDDEDQDDDDDDDEELQDWDDWNAEDREGEEEEDGFDSDFLCLFCDSRFTAIDALFDHCISTHYFDFRFIREALRLDFYGSLKLINYVRSQVAENKCWSCGVCCDSNLELLNHLHEVSNLEDIKPLWVSDAFLKPFLQDDSLLFSFGEDEEADGDYAIVSEVDKDELMNNFKRFEEMSVDSDVASASNDQLNLESSSGNIHSDGLISRELVGPSERKTNDKHLRAYFPNHVTRDIKIVNEDYFGSYSSFGIHREMLGDKVRMDAYSQAILKNPSLFNGAVVMDVGCGTGILSLFAAQAGASRVIAIEASEKMAAVATQIAKDNGFLRGTCSTSDSDHCNGVVEVVRTMVEELDEKINIQPNSIDVLLSEWMGYCLLYESMLTSVLYARDRWLKPGGAILPDTATIIVAGFGKGGTSLPFWEDVYGFKMSCVGKELVEGAAQIPIVDVVDGHDLVTKAAVLKTFDLVTMRPDDVDFTATVELEPSLSNSADLESKTTRCYGAILWFETGFTSRFCKQTPANLSTSPHTPSTHWSQTILTFREPIVMASKILMVDKSAAIGSNACPATRINLRMSIVRASQHRSIDISMETVGIGPDGRKRSWPVQLFYMR